MIKCGFRRSIRRGKIHKVCCRALGSGTSYKRNPYDPLSRAHLDEQAQTERVLCVCFGFTLIVKRQVFAYVLILVYVRVRVRAYAKIEGAANLAGVGTHPLNNSLNLAVRVGSDALLLFRTIHDRQSLQEAGKAPSNG